MLLFFYKFQQNLINFIYFSTRKKNHIVEKITTQAKGEKENPTK